MGFGASLQQFYFNMTELLCIYQGCGVVFNYRYSLLAIIVANVVTK
jgi:hypothetical protein